MNNIKKKFESESKTRINLIGQSKSGKSTLALGLIKSGIFYDSKLLDEQSDLNTIFSTEILCTGPRSNEVMLYINLKDKDILLNKIKDDVLNYLDEAFLEVLSMPKVDTVNNERNKQNKFFSIFNNEMKGNYEVSLNRFFNKKDLRQVFAHVNFDMLFDEFNKGIVEESLETRDDMIWKKYFKGFETDFKDKYDEWVEKIKKYYVHSKEGCRYLNSEDYMSDSFKNEELAAIGKVLYGVDESCGIIIERVYIEAPGRENTYSGVVFIDYFCENYENNIIKEIEKRIAEDYKELFIVVDDCNDFNEYLSYIKENLNQVTLRKRLYCILNKFDIYKENSNKYSLSELKERAANSLRIDDNKIIITSKFMDIDKKSLNMLNTNNDFLRLIKLIKIQSNDICRPVKIRNASYNNVVSIELNQERMSVQALVNMLYEKYNKYLVTLWSKVKKELEEYDDNHNKKYCVNVTRTLIRNRKRDYKGYKHKFNNDVVVDFSMRSGEQNDAKKILKMLLNYGYHTVGFNANENKILVKVNGEISKEDKINLIDSIKGRLEESAITYFENAFLANVTNKKFTKNNVSLALESEKNITIDDFYLAFNEAFKKMSENIERYDINIQ